MDLRAEIVNDLSSEDANQSVITEIERITALYQKDVAFSSSWWRQWPILLTYLGTLEGALVTACLILLSIERLVIRGYARFSVSLAGFVISMFLISTFLLINIVIFYKLRRAEVRYRVHCLHQIFCTALLCCYYYAFESITIQQVRPFAQVREALRLWKEYAMDFPGSAESGSVLWDPPSSSLVNVCRGGLWRKVPDVMVAKGDIFKLRAGEVFPTAATRVEVTAVSTSENALIKLKESWEERVKLPESKLPNHSAYIIATDSTYTQGQIFLPLCRRHVRRARSQSTNSLSDTSSDSSAPSPHRNRLWSFSRMFAIPGSPQSFPEKKAASVLSPILSDDFHSESSPHENLHFSNPVRACPSLACCTFQATSFGCTVLLTKFFERSLQAKAFQRRKKTSFFETTNRLKKYLVRTLFFNLCITLIASTIWTMLIFIRSEILTIDMKDSAIIYTISNFYLSVYLVLSFMPLVYRILIEITDVWGNARLQSLFQWLEETRFLPEPTISQTFGYDKPASSLSSSTTSISSGGTSVDSRMSVSRLPLRNQFSELFAVLGQVSLAIIQYQITMFDNSALMDQGLDGASNLLHTLNATTSVVFVDKDGLLTDTQMTVQEVCVAETLSRIGNRNKDSKSNVIMDTIHDSANASSEEMIRRGSPGSAPPVPERVVFDIMPRLSAPDGQKFETPWRAEAHENALRPLAALLATARLPLGEAHYQDRAHAHWLFALTLRDLFQSEGFMSEAFKECTCAIKSLCEVPEAVINRLTISRLFIAVQSRIFRPFRHVILPKSSSPSSRTTTIQGENLEGEYSGSGGKALFASWLIRDIKTGSLHMLAKGQPKAILRRSQFYFDGTAILPMTRTMRRSFLELTTQWRGNNLECFAVGYRPLSASQQRLCLNSLDEHSVFVVDTECVSITAGPLLQATTESVAENDKLYMSEASNYGRLNHQSLEEAWESQPFLEDIRPTIGTPEVNGNKLDNSTEMTTSKLKEKSLIEVSANQIFSEGTLHRYTPVNIFPGTKSTISAAPIVKCTLLTKGFKRPKNLNPLEQQRKSTESKENTDTQIDSSSHRWLNNLLTNEIGGLEYVNYCNVMKPVKLSKCEDLDSLPSLVTLPQSQTLASSCPLVSPDFPHNHLTFGTNASQNCPSATKKSGKEVGNVVRQLVNNQILLGMVALKLTSPQELAGRVDSLHEAGIRFIFMSQENNKKTKSVGRLLGLETDWNSMISLMPTPRGIINVLGNVVVPSGIDDIKKHIKEVDNVPLQVSLFSNGTPYTMKEMLKILQENGEMVTCVGSAHRSTNFDLFDQANCSVSVAVDPSPICRKCLGRRCTGRVDRHLFPTLPIEFAIGAALVSLQCSLQINMKSQPPSDQPIAAALPVNCASDPRWLGGLLYEAFKESRRIVDSIQLSIAFFAGISTAFIAPMLILNSILFLPPYFRDLSLTSHLLITLPIISASLLYTPAGDTIMKEFPLRITDNEKNKHEVWNTCFSYMLRFVPSSFICLFLLCIYFEYITPLHSKNLLNRSSNLDSDIIQKFTDLCINYQGLLVIGGKWIHCLSIYQLIDGTKKFDPIPIFHCQIMCQLLMLIFTFIIAISFIDSLIVVPPTHNIYLIITLCFLSLIYALGIFIELFFTNTISFFMSPNIIFYLIFFSWIPAIILINELVKRGARDRQELQQKYLKLLFTTKLGMWSPK